MERPRRWSTVIGSIAFSIVVAVLMAAVLSGGLAAQDQATRFFVVCKYEDLNMDGIQAASEPFLNGWTFTLQGPEGPPEQKTTSEDGCAQFGMAVLPSVPYTVCEQLKPGWVNSDPGGGTPCESYSVSPNYAGPIEVFFGNYQRSVGGATKSTSELALLAPWLALGAVALIGFVATVVRLRRGISA